MFEMMNEGEVDEANSGGMSGQNIQDKADLSLIAFHKKQDVALLFEI